MNHLTRSFGPRIPKELKKKEEKMFQICKSYVYSSPPLYRKEKLRDRHTSHGIRLQFVRQPNFFSGTRKKELVKRGLAVPETCFDQSQRRCTTFFLCSSPLAVANDLFRRASPTFRSYRQVTTLFLGAFGPKSPKKKEVSRVRHAANAQCPLRPLCGWVFVPKFGLPNPD